MLPKSSSSPDDGAQETVIAAIRRLKRRGEDLSFTAQRGQDLMGLASRTFGSYRSAIEAAGIKYETVWRRRLTKWNQPTIRKELRKLFGRGRDLSSRQIRASHPSLFGATIHWFGSYQSGIEAAGLDYSRIRRQDPHRWSRAQIIRELRRLKRERKPLHHNAIDREMPELVTAAYRYFGTYRRAVEAAGINYLKVRIRPQRTWDKRRIVAELKQLRRDHKGLWARSVRLTHPYLPRVAKQRFGSYSAAARAAGIDAAAIKPPPYRMWSRERVVEEIKRLGARSPKALAPTSLRLAKPYFVRVAARRFGTYRKAVEAAGFDYLTIGRVNAPTMTDVEVVARLKTLQQRGKDLRYAVINRQEPRLLNAARRRFGSYEAAVKAAGIAYPPLPPLRHWSEKLVLSTLRDLHGRGEDLRYRAVKEHRLQLYQAAKYYFGSYTNAVRVGEISYVPMAVAQRASERVRRLTAYREERVTTARAAKTARKRAAKLRL